MQLRPPRRLTFLIGVRSSGQSFPYVGPPPRSPPEYTMTHHHHAVIWIDHREARIFRFGAADVDRLVLHPDHPTKHIHHKANTIGSGHVSADQDFLRTVAQSVADAGAILITGPANTKHQMMAFLRDHE